MLFDNSKVTKYPIECGKDRYVWFRFNGGNPIRVKEDLNKIETFKEREVYGLALASVVDDRLKRGWVPIKKKTLPQPEDKRYNIIEVKKPILLKVSTQYMLTLSV